MSLANRVQPKVTRMGWGWGKSLEDGRSARLNRPVFYAPDTRELSLGSGSGSGWGWGTGSSEFSEES